MKIKVCGLREPANIAAVAAAGADWLGFIFYPRSSRYVGDTLALPPLPPTVEKVGVFVDAPAAEVAATAARYGLTAAQLHGAEPPAACAAVRAAGLKTLKAFAVDAAFDFAQVAPYAGVCDYFLFDTKGALPGGNGTAFDWRALTRYTGLTPFLLSGGLGPANLPALRQFSHPRLAGYDFNSQLETAPGVKDVAQTQQLITALRPAILSS